MTLVWNKGWKVAGYAGAVLVAGILSFGALHAAGQPAGRRGGGPLMGGPGPGGPGMLGFGREFRDLDLTDAQREQIRGILQQRRTEFDSLGERLRTARRAVADAIATDPIDENLIRQRHQELSGIEADMAVAGARVRAEIFQILTPEQQQKLRDRRAELQKRVDERRQQMQQRREQRQNP